MKKHIKTIKHLFVLLLLLTTIVIRAQSSKKSFAAIVNKTELLFGNTIKVEFELKNVDGEFEAPAFADFNILSGPNTSSSTYIVNGVASSTQKYTYYLKPKKEGKSNIEAAYIINDDKDNNMETKPITILVKPNPTGIIEEEVEEDMGMQFFSFPDIRTDGDFLRQQWGGNIPEKQTQTQENSKPKRKIKRF